MPPNKVGDETPQCDKNAPPPVDYHNMATVVNGFDDMPCDKLRAHRHREMAAADECRVDKSGTDVGEADIKMP